MTETASSGTSRYTRNGRRRGTRRFAAPLGFAVWALVLLLVAALIFAAVQGVLDKRRQEKLHQDMYDFIYPVMLQNPTAFQNVADQPQDALLLAAIWRVTDRELARRQQDPQAQPRYDVDALGRWCIPIREISASYAFLFGDDIQPTYRTIGEAGTAQAHEYSLPKSCYYVPVDTMADSAYTPVLDTVQQTESGYIARVGYVRNGDVPQNPDDLTAELATYVQLYHVTEINGRWALRAVTDQ